MPSESTHAVTGPGEGVAMAVTRHRGRTPRLRPTGADGVSGTPANQERRKPEAGPIPTENNTTADSAAHRRASAAVTTKPQKTAFRENGMRTSVTRGQDPNNKQLLLSVCKDYIHQPIKNIGTRFIKQCVGRHAYQGGVG